MAKERFVAEDLHIRVHPDLRRLVVAEAVEDGLNLVDVVVRVLAAHYRRPDLATVPRKLMGRPRKENLVKGSKNGR